MLEDNKEKREDMTAHPIYLVLRRSKEQQSGPGAKIKEFYAPKIIWAKCLVDITSFVQKNTSTYGGKPERPVITQIVDNAREAASLKFNEAAQNRDKDIIQMQDSDINIEKINCIVVFF